jgi:hypothetical protein
MKYRLYQWVPKEPVSNEVKNQYQEVTEYIMK